MYSCLCTFMGTFLLFLLKLTRKSEQFMARGLFLLDWD